MQGSKWGLGARQVLGQICSIDENDRTIDCLLHLADKRVWWLCRLTKRPLWRDSSSLPELPSWHSKLLNQEYASLHWLPWGNQESHELPHIHVQEDSSWEHLRARLLRGKVSRDLQDSDHDSEEHASSRHSKHQEGDLELHETGAKRHLHLWEGRQTVSGTRLKEYKSWK